MGWDDGDSGKGSRWLEDELVCAAPGNEAKGVRTDECSGEGQERDGKLTEKRSHGEKCRSGRKKEEKWRKSYEEEEESGGGDRMFEEVWELLGSLGSSGVVVGGEELFFSASIPTIQLSPPQFVRILRQTIVLTLIYG
jgi:hypothetical protein